MDETRKPEFFICHTGDWQFGGAVYGYGRSEDEALEDAYVTIGKFPPDDDDPSASEELEVSSVPEHVYTTLLETGFLPPTC